jgi:diacylglycerol kinase (ATP)
MVDRTSGGLAVVVNPRALHGPCTRLWEEALDRLQRARPVACIETTGEGHDGDHVAAFIAAQRPAIVVAAGGDGTVRDVAEALHRTGLPTPPALALVPLGTANNVARSLGLLALRQRGAAAVELAITAILAGTERWIDLGRVGPSIFIGSFAVGMDAAILAARNRWRRRWRPGATRGGYSLYLLSCAVNLARHRGVTGHLTSDGESHDVTIYDLLVVNTALYAGEFRFDATDHSADGRLDLHVFASPIDYVRAFVAAWRRQLRHARGLPIHPPARLRRIQRVELTLSRPLAAQLDGEEHACASHYEVCIVPHALRVRLP